MKRSINGFTIVELLIVIVVIAILAAISIVAHNGIQDKAVESTLKSDLRNASTQLEIAFLEQGAYPASSPSNTPPSLLQSSDSTVFTYTSDGQTYCLTASSSRSGVVPHHTSQAGGIAEGACAGHDDVDGEEGGGQPSTPALVNLHPNPSIEVNSSGFAGAHSSQVIRDTTRAHTGSASLRVTMPNSANSGQAGASILHRNIGDFLEPNTTYTVSAHVYVPPGTVDMWMFVFGSGRASVVDPPGRTATAKGSWVRIHNTFTTGSSGQIILFVINSSATTTPNTQLWVDSIMVTEGTQLHPYADGSSPNWSWTGTPWLSRSEGPEPD